MPPASGGEAMRSEPGSVDVSLIILNRNEGILLERCLRSCLAQTFPGRFYQVVVVDVASQDCSQEVLRAYAPQVTAVSLEDPSSTLGQAFVEGMRRARGRFVMPVRAQDFLSDYMLLFQAIWLYQNAEHDAVLVDYWLVEPGSDAKVQRVSAAASPCPYGTMYRKEPLLEAGLYAAPANDWSPERLYAKVAKTGRIGHLPIPFYRYQQAPVAAGAEARR